MYIDNMSEKNIFIFYLECCILQLASYEIFSLPYHSGSLSFVDEE